MNSEEFLCTERSPSVATTRCVVLSPWVNERFPAWEQLLSAHDVARLTRRPRWVLLSLMVLGRFPRRARFRGHAIGWLRPDIVVWLAKRIQSPPCQQVPASTHRSGTGRQFSLSLEGAEPCAARKVRHNCSMRWNGRR